MTQLAKSQCVMHVDEMDDEFVGFVNGDPEDIATQSKCLVLLRPDWVDFGRPNEITVTIEPGDKLNDEGVQ